MTGLVAGSFRRAGRTLGCSGRRTSLPLAFSSLGVRFCRGLVGPVPRSLWHGRPEPNPRRVAGGSWAVAAAGHGDDEMSGADSFVGPRSGVFAGDVDARSTVAAIAAGLTLQPGPDPPDPGQSGGPAKGCEKPMAICERPAMCTKGTAQWECRRRAGLRPWPGREAGAGRTSRHQGQEFGDRGMFGELRLAVEPRRI